MLGLSEITQLSLDKKLENFNGVFFNSNECETEKTHSMLANASFKQEGGHLGVGTLMSNNFDICCIAKAKFAILIDTDQETVEFNKLSIEILKKTEDPTEFISKISQLVFDRLKLGLEERRKVYYSFYFDGNSNCTLDSFSSTHTVDQIIAKLKPELERQYSWLLKNNYSYMHRLALDNKIISIQLNLSDVDSFKKIALILNQQMNALMNTVNASNVRDHISIDNFFNKDKQIPLESVAKCIELIANPDAVIVDSIHKEDEDPKTYQLTSRIEQRTSLGKIGEYKPDSTYFITRHFITSTTLTSQLVH